MMSDYAFYKMERNAFLRNCLCVVASPTSTEITEDALQAPYAFLLVASRRPLDQVRTLEDMRTEQLFDPEHPILLRIASECLPGLFGDSHCDCEPQRVASLREIDGNRQGIYVHLPQEGQGNGLFYKAQELQIQVSGIDPSGEFVGQKSVVDAANLLLGDEPLDKRGYYTLKRVFDECQLNRHHYVLLSQSPEKAKLLRSLGITIIDSRDAAHIVTADNAGEYLAKLYTKGFTLTDSELEEIKLTLQAADQIPGRVQGLLSGIEEDLDAGQTLQANEKLLRSIINVGKEKGGEYKDVLDLGLLQDAKAYEEYQVEMETDVDGIVSLLESGVLRGFESLRYEENHFYDLAYFKETPVRSLKIRNAFRLTDRTNPIERKFIYKTPIGNNLYRIRSVVLESKYIAQLLALALRDYERHMLPVFTHNVLIEGFQVTLLLKRYNRSLRTLSLMGPQSEVRGLQDAIEDRVGAKVIDDPSNYRYLDPHLSVDFDVASMSEEELSLYRRYSFG